MTPFPHLHGLSGLDLLAIIFVAIVIIGLAVNALVGED